MFLNGSAGGYLSLGAGGGRGEGVEFVRKVVRGNQFYSAVIHIVCGSVYCTLLNCTLYCTALILFCFVLNGSDLYLTALH